MKLSKLFAHGPDGKLHTILKTTAGDITDLSLGFRAPHGAAEYSLESDGTTLRMNPETGHLESVDGRQAFRLETASR